MRILFFLLLGCSQSAVAQKPISVLIKEYVKAQEVVNGFSGVVLVTKDGKTIHQEAYGLANREWSIPNTVNTRFRTGSITKQFTATAILQLVQAGKLTPEDKLSRFYPSFPKGDSVTIHMLLNHTSGIKSFTSVPGFGRIEWLPLPKDSILALFINQPYDFSPGTRYQYNNSAFFLLANIIEKVTGMDYHTYLERNVFSKAGLQHTGPEKPDSIMLQNASGYRKTPTGWAKAKAISMEFPFGSGHLVSTVADLYRWHEALFSGKLIADSLLTKMTTPYLNKYGYGLDIDSLEGHYRIGHDGNIAGAASYSYHFPKDKLSVIILSNRQGSIQGLGRAISYLVFGLPVEMPYVHKEAKIDAGILDRYVGTYKTPENTSFELVKNEGKLYRKLGANLIELKPESDTKFFMNNGSDTQIFFDKAAAYKAFIVRDGFVSALEKVK